MPVIEHHHRLPPEFARCCDEVAALARLLSVVLVGLIIGYGAVGLAFVGFLAWLAVAA